LEISYNNRENNQDKHRLSKTKKKKFQRHWKSKGIIIIIKEKKKKFFKKSIARNQMKPFESRHVSKLNLKPSQKRWDMIFQVMFSNPSTRRSFIKLSRIKWLA